MGSNESSSSGSGVASWIPWILTTVVGGAFVAQSLNPETPTAGGGHSIVGSQEVFSEGAQQAERMRRMEEPLFEHFGIRPDEEDSGDKYWTATLAEDGLKIEQRGTPPNREPVDEKLRSHLDRKRLSFMIMTVADPVDAGDNYRFDLQLDALHTALAANRHDQWVFDSCYLPWQVFRDRVGQKPELALLRHEHWYQDEPGVLLYRRPWMAQRIKDPPDQCPCFEEAQQGFKEELLLVYLVGEMATAGIQRDAFLLAVDEIHRLRCLSCAEKAAATDEHNNPLPCGTACITVPVVGPTFSGAAHSLIEAIDAAKTKYNGRGNYEFGVITGSATSVNPAEFESRKIPFAAATCDLESERAAVLKFLERDHRWPAHRNRSIAWLVESGTTFGANFSVKRFSPTSKDPKKSQDKPQPQGSQQSKDKQSKPDRSIDQLVYPYPLQISRVRKSFESRLENAKGAAAGTLDPIHAAAALPFDALENTRDMPAPQSPQMTAPAVELILGQILDSIHRKRCDYVGILATDIRDTIFLAEMVKLHCPTTQLVVMQPDLLHTHPKYADALTGALVVSSYPLFPEGLDWTAWNNDADRGGRVMLSNPSYYGVYNAVLLQRDQTRECSPAFTLGSEQITVTSGMEGRASQSQLIGYRAPFGKREGVQTPGIWIQRIGMNKIFPVHWAPPLDAIRHADGASRARSALIPVGPSANSTIDRASIFYESFGLWIVFLIVLWTLILLALWTPPKLRNGLEWLAPWGGRQSDLNAVAAPRCVQLARWFAWGLMVISSVLISAAVGVGITGSGVDTGDVVADEERKSVDETVQHFVIFTEKNLSSGVSLLLPALLVFIAFFAMAFGRWRRVYLIERHSDAQLWPRKKSPPTNFLQTLAFPLIDRRVLSSKLVTVVGLLVITALYLLVMHTWPSNSCLSGSHVLYHLTWYGLSGAILGWWLSLLGLCSLYFHIRNDEFKDQRKKWHSGAFHDRPTQTLIQRLAEGTTAGVGRLLLEPGPRSDDAVSRHIPAALSEDVVQYVNLYRRLQIYFVHLRNRTFSHIVAAVLLVLAVNSYPFTSMPWLRLLTTGGLLVLSLLACWFYAKLEQDEFLAFLMGSPVDAVAWNWPMIQRLGLLVTIAFVTLIFQVAPDSSGWLGSMFEPIVRLGK